MPPNPFPVNLFLNKNLRRFALGLDLKSSTQGEVTSDLSTTREHFSHPKRDSNSYQNNYSETKRKRKSENQIDQETLEAKERDHQTAG